MKRLIGITVGLALGVIGPVVAQQTSPPGPKETGIEFARAIESGNTSAARDLAIGTDEEKKIVDSTVYFVGAVKKFSDSATKKFADQAAQITGQTLNLDMAKQMEDTDAKEDGDTAILTNPKQLPGQQPLRLKKVGGQWKVDLSVLSQGAAMQGQSPTQMQAMLNTWAGAFNEMAAEIEQGKYATADDARAAFSAKMVSAQAAAGPTTNSSAVPATAPADSAR